MTNTIQKRLLVIILSHIYDQSVHLQSRIRISQINDIKLTPLQHRTPWLLPSANSIKPIHRLHVTRRLFRFHGSCSSVPLTYFDSSSHSIRKWILSIVHDFQWTSGRLLMFVILYSQGFLTIDADFKKKNVSFAMACVAVSI